MLVALAVFAGAAFAFITSWDETIVALFVTSRAVTTLPRRIWEGLADNIDPAIAALGRRMNVSGMIVVATAAVREAEDGPAFCEAEARALISFGRSRVSITSNRATASSALFDCN